TLDRARREGRDEVEQQVDVEDERDIARRYTTRAQARNVRVPGAGLVADLPLPAAGGQGRIDGGARRTEALIHRRRIVLFAVGLEQDPLGVELERLVVDELVDRGAHRMREWRRTTGSGDGDRSDQIGAGPVIRERI